LRFASSVGLVIYRRPGDFVDIQDHAALTGGQDGDR
jgi:hypothetical protein